MRRPWFICAISLLLLVGYSQSSFGTVYYVSTSGKNSNSCSTATRTTLTSAKRTIGNGVNCLGSGDTLLIRGGVYNETGNGVEWPSGTSSNRITIRGYPGETVTMRPGSGLTGAGAMVQITDVAYLTFENMVFDNINYRGELNGARNVMKISGASHHLEFIDIKLLNAEVRSMGVLDATGNDIQNDPSRTGSNRWMRTEVANNGGYAHYITSPNNTFDSCNVHDNGGYGFHIYSDFGHVDNNIVKNCKIWNNGFSQNPNCANTIDKCFNPGLLLSSGTNNAAYNNLIFGNGQGGIQANGSSPKVYNNTMYNNRCGDYNWAGIIVGADGAVIRNNIIYNNECGPIMDEGEATDSGLNFTGNPSFN